MRINKNLIIENFPLQEYLNHKNAIIINYLGPNKKTIIDAIFLGLSIVNRDNNSWQVKILCDDFFKKWIPYPLEYISKNKKNRFYTYHLNDLENSKNNIIQIIYDMGIKSPLKNVSFESLNNNKNIALIAVNCNTKYISLGDNKENDICNFLFKKGFNIKKINVDESEYSYPKLIDIISKSNIVIGTDNHILKIANAFRNKKVIGIFGPTIPDSNLYQNSMKIIQISDESPSIDKQCFCQNPRICHKGYKFGDIPYCFKTIKIEKLLNKINDLI